MISTASTGLAGELHEQPAEPGAEVHVGHELVGVVAGRRGHVDGAAQQPAAQHGGDLLGHGDAGAAAGVGGATASAALVSSRCGAASGGGRHAPGLHGHRGGGDAAAGERPRERLAVDGAGRAGTDDARARA